MTDPTRPWINTSPVREILMICVGLICLAIAHVMFVQFYKDRAQRVVDIAPNALQCPAPTRAGEVSTITLIHHGDAIKFRCQLVRDWQLLNPKAAKPERITP